MTHGITPTGFVKPTLTELIEDIKTDILGLYPKASFDPSKAITQMVVAAAERHYSIWNLCEAMYNQNNVYTASGISLDYLLTLNNIKRFSAKYTYITGVKIIGLQGTVVPAGFVIVSTVDPKLKFEVVDEAIIGPDLGLYTPNEYGDVEVTLRSLEKGPFPAFGGTVTEIEKGSFGIELVEAPNDAIVGRYTETDEELLIRREKSVALNKSATERGILAAIDELNFIEDKVELTYIDVISNRQAYTDSRGRPPHSVECIVEQADFGSSRDDEIAQTVFDSAGCGTVIFGTTGPFVVRDLRDREHFAYFTKPALVPIYVSVKLYVTQMLSPGELEQLSHEIALYGNTLGVGSNVSVIGKKGLAAKITNDKVLHAEMFVGTASPPFHTYIDISSGLGSTPERPIFDTANISITQELGVDV